MNINPSTLLSTILKREIEIFLQVAKSGSMSEAAPALSLNQPAISKALFRLENELGTSLFSRNRDGVKLTQDGRELQIQLVKWMDQWRSEQEKTKVRHLTIGCHQSVAIEFFPQFVTQIRKFFPGTEFAFRFLTSLQVTEKVAALEIDLGIVVNPIKRRQVIVRPIREDFVSYFAKSASEKGPLLVHPDMLYGSRIKTDSTEVLQIADYEVIAEMVKHGKFVGILPSSVAKRHELTQIDRKLFAVDMSLIFHEDRFDRETAKKILKLFG
jgi:DNA-binding transcriptional LysR family regulator